MAGGGAAVLYSLDYLLPRFIDGPQMLDRQIEETDLKPDRDRRFRVSDFFCHEGTWQMTLSRLVDESYAALMDLRGCSPQNCGVVYDAGACQSVSKVRKDALGCSIVQEPILQRPTSTDL